ncbi:MAG: 50S ribosomal protein L31e [Candidatus Bathyarchaeia archaeon]
MNSKEETQSQQPPEADDAAEKVADAITGEGTPSEGETEAVKEEPLEEKAETEEEEEEEEEEEIEEAEEEERKEIVEEKFFTIPLGQAWAHPFPTRTPRSVRIVRKFMERHMKAEGIRIHPTLNALLWRRGIEKPPRRVRVRATRDEEGVVEVRPAQT